MISGYFICWVTTNPCGDQAEVKGKLCYHFFIWLHILFYPMLSCCNSLNKKAQKELYERRQQQIGDKDIFKNFSFIFWVQQPFNGWENFPWIKLKWLNPPVKVFKNTLIVSWYICVLIYLSIWYVLVAFGSLSKSSVLVHSLIGPFRSFCILAYC